jgi:D-glycero-alpha-D-manno-heptose 1-phosphate guanylyltransferase
MEAIVLAGGFGTRLQKVVSNVPKPMALINNKPFLYYLLKLLQKNNIDKVILSVGYKWEIIKDYFGEKFEDIELVYSIENEPLGTGGAIKKAIDYLENDQSYVLNGDTFFNISLNELKLFENSKIILALKRMQNFDRYGNVKIDKYGNIIAFEEKKYTKNGNINGGIYLLKKDVFDVFDLPKTFSFEEFLETNYKKLNAKGKIFDDYFIDIGIPEDYEKAKKDFCEKSFIFR